MHLNIQHHVKVNVTSSDSTVLDSVESALPEVGADEVGAEYDGAQRSNSSPELAEGEERLVARVVLQTTYDSNGGVHTYAETHAQNLYDALAAIDYRNAEYECRHYKSPTGGIVQSQLEGYYDTNPGEKPVDDNGEAYVPTTWDPSRHVVSEVSSQ